MERVNILLMCKGIWPSNANSIFLSAFDIGEPGELSSMGTPVSILLEALGKWFGTRIGSSKSKASQISEIDAAAFD